DLLSPLPLPEWAMLAEFSHDILAVLAGDGTIHFVSSAVSRDLGYTAEELTGENVELLLRPEDVPAVRRDIHTFTAQPNMPISSSCRLRSKDGSWRRFEVSGRSFRSESGEVLFACAYRDVTELRRMKAERRVISDVIHALNQTSNLDELLKHIH